MLTLLLPPEATGSAKRLGPRMIPMLVITSRMAASEMTTTPSRLHVAPNIFGQGQDGHDGGSYGDDEADDGGSAASGGCGSRCGGGGGGAGGVGRAAKVRSDLAVTVFVHPPGKAYTLELALARFPYLAGI